MEWSKIEQNVNKAEKAKRKSHKASNILHSETEMIKKERQEKTEEDILKKSTRERVAKKALNREEQFEQEAENILGEKDSPERVLINFRAKELAKSLRYADALEKQRAEIIREETEILKSIGESPSGEEQEALVEIRAELEENSQVKDNMMKLSPEAYFGLHLKELKEYKKNLEDGKIAETPYVKEQAEDIVKHLRAGKPCLIYGHLGSGKTELAMHIAKKYIGKEALVISGSKHTSIAELYGHQTLSINEIKKEELDLFEKEVEDRFKKWVEENPETDENEKNRTHDRILQTYLAQFKGGTASDFFLGPIYRAMEEGRPVIIDEVNAIPHEVLISLNHILTRKVGDKVNVQQNSGSAVEVTEGFGIIMTGNLNQGQEIYVERQDLDPAFLSRLHKIEYKYLPQSADVTLAEAGEEDELFSLLVADVMDRYGNMEVPEDAIIKLWNLSKAARITQDVFSGKEISSAFYFQEAGGRAVKYLLKENLLSMRALGNVISQWKSEGYAREIDYYIWNNFIREGTVASDRAYLFQLFKDRFGFFKSDGWEQDPEYGAGGVITSFDIKPPKNKSGKNEFFGPREVVEFAFGKAPKRAKWPETSESDAEPEEKEVKAREIFMQEQIEQEELLKEDEKRIRQLLEELKDQEII